MYSLWVMRHTWAFIQNFFSLEHIYIKFSSIWFRIWLICRVWNKTILKSNSALLCGFFLLGLPSRNIIFSVFDKNVLQFERILDEEIIEILDEEWIYFFSEHLQENDFKLMTIIRTVFLKALLNNKEVLTT